MNASTPCSDSAPTPECVPSTPPSSSAIRPAPATSSSQSGGRTACSLGNRRAGPGPASRRRRGPPCRPSARDGTLDRLCGPWRPGSGGCVELLQRIADKRARIGVIGLGYVGLPLAVEFAHAGFEVIGYDVDAGKVAAINRGESYIPDVPTPAVAAAVKAGTLRATTDPADLADVDVVDICVPTPLRKTKDPDLSYVVQAVEVTAKVLRKGQLVILESTTYPGTTDEVLQAYARSRRPGGGRRLLPGVLARARRPGQSDLRHPQHPEGGGRGQRRAARRRRTRCTAAIIDTIVPVSSTRVAEMVKLLENTFRAVNIGLVNEMALMCDRMGIDVWEVIDAANDQAVRLHAVLPGAGAGRALHPDRSLLPVVEGEAERLRGALHRAGRPDQRRHARVRRRPRRRGAQHREEGGQRLAGARDRAWPTSATSTTCASRRRSTSSSCSSAAAPW